MLEEDNLPFCVFKELHKIIGKATYSTNIHSETFYYANRVLLEIIRVLYKLLPILHGYKNSTKERKGKRDSSKAER